MFDERKAKAVRAIAQRDMQSALEANLNYRKMHPPFVWPDIYYQTYYYQRVGPLQDLHGMPVVMRSARTSLRVKYTTPKYFIMIFERYLALHRITIVDKPASILFRHVWGELKRKWRYHNWRHYPFEYSKALSRGVLVNGKFVPMDPARISILEKSVRVIEKIDAIAA